MAQYITSSSDAGTAFAVLVCAALTTLAVGVNGYSVPLASDPTNVRNQWELPGLFGGVSIPGNSLKSPIRYGYNDDINADSDFFLSPLQPVDPYSQDYSDEHGNSGYEPFWNPRSRSGSLLSMTSSSAASPLSTGRIWRSNNLGSEYSNSFLKDSNRRGRSSPFTRGTPALSMANYMQNSNNGNNRDNRNNRDDRNNYNNNNRGYNDNHNHNNNNNNNYNRDNYNNRDNYDYDDRNNRGDRRSYNDLDRYGPPRNNQPRGTNRFNTVGGVGSVNGSNVSREGRSMQFQNRKESNTAGRSGRMMDDAFSQFAPDPSTMFESRRPNDGYAKGGYRQDSRTGHWTDPNSNFNINESPRSSYSNTQYSNPPSSSSSFTSVPPGDYVSAPDIRGRTGYDRGRVGAAGGNVPYDNAYYNNNDNYENRDYYDYNRDPNNSDNDFYSINGNIMNNRRGSRGEKSSGGPGMDQNYYNIDYENSNRRMDRGGGMMRYRPNNQRADGGYYGNGYDYEVGRHDEYYDSSGSFYNSEGKRVRRFDPYSDRPEGYYNPKNLSNDATDPDRMIQNQRRRDGRDVQNGAHLRRYDPDWDSRQGLYDEASLYDSDVKGTRSYARGYGDDMGNRVVGRARRRVNTEDPSVLGGGWGETGGRNRHPMSSTSRFGDYQEGDYIEDGYDRGQARFNRQGDSYRRDQYDYDDYGGGGARRNLGRRDMDNERDYYRSGSYGGPDIRGDDSMERFRQGKDVKKTDPYGFETGNTPSSKKRIQRPVSGRTNGANRRPSDMSEGRTVNGSYNAPRGRRGGGGGRINGSAGRDRGLSLDDLNEML